MKKAVFLILFLLFLSACKFDQNSYEKDLHFIYQTIEGNHPGVYNDQDPEFNKNLKESYSDAKAKITSAKNSCNSKEAIDEFVESFNDLHLWVSWDNALKKQTTTDVIRRFSLLYISKNICWITLPTFFLNSYQKKDFKQLISDISALQSVSSIIFDLRGNQGGNSAYGSQIINALFGKEYADPKRDLFNEKVYVDWRVSEGNINHLSSLVGMYPNSGLQKIEYGLKESLKQRQKYYREYTSSSGGGKDCLPQAPRLNPKMIVIIDSFNGSAVLDFIDELKMVTPHLTLIGQPTKADRLYMEVRSVPLPSGVGHFFFPIKVYRNRQRFDNQPYLPDIQYKNIHHTAALQRFILTKIKKGRL